MASSADGDSDFIGLGVLECVSNVFLGTGLDEERWAHAVVVHVAGSGILVFVFTIVGTGGACRDLDARYVCDVNRHGSGIFVWYTLLRKGLIYN